MTLVRFLILLLAAAAILSMMREAATAPCEPDAIRIAPGQSVQAAVDRAGPGAAFCLKSGIHREQTIRPKAAQRFFGERGAILNGSRLLGGFVRQGSYWVASWPGPYGPRRGQCLPQEPACDVPEGVFLDGAALRAAPDKADLHPGRFYIDPAEALVYLADDPEGHSVEAASVAAAFEATAPGVLISDLIIEKYASRAQDGAIQVQTPDGSGWTIRNCEIRLNSGAGIAVGNGTTVQACRIHHNGQIGITGVGDGVVIQDNEIWANNARGFQFRWEAGGIKLAESKDVSFRRNKIHDNTGPGLWCDINCDRSLYEDNVVERNEGPGIFYEISSRSLIRQNHLRDNGIDGKAWFWGVNILVAASEQVEIHHNQMVVAPGGCGIVFTDQGRAFEGSRGSVGTYKTRSNLVHDNVTTFEGSGCAGAASDVGPADENYSIIETGGNDFDRNVYRIPRTGGVLRFEWGHEVLDWSALSSKGVEPHGQLVLY